MTDIIKTSYDNTKVSANGDVTARSSIPADINLPTRLNLASTLRQSQNNIMGLSDGIKNFSRISNVQELTKNNIDATLSNFKPPILKNSVQNIKIQPSTTMENIGSSAKKLALAGVDSATKALAEQFKELTKLSKQKEMLLKQVDNLKNQMDNLSRQIMNMTNLGEEQLLNDLEKKLDDIETIYNTTKAVLDNIRKQYNDLYDKIEKARIARELALNKIPDKIHELENVLLNLPEIPLAIQFPSFPTLPALNLTKASFKQKLSELKTAVLRAGRASAVKSIDKSAEDSKEKINTGNNMDFAQTAVSKARKGLKEARALAETYAARKRAAIDSLNEAGKSQLSAMQKQIEVMEVHINTSTNTEKMRIDSNIKNIRSPAPPPEIPVKVAEQQTQEAKSKQQQYEDKKAADAAKAAAQLESDIKNYEMIVEDDKLKVAQKLKLLNQQKADPTNDKEDLEVYQNAYNDAVKDYNWQLAWLNELKQKRNKSS